MLITKQFEGKLIVFSVLPYTSTL